MNIAIIYGGKSGEHEVSIISASSIVRHLDSKKYTIYLIGITKDGRWFFQDSSQINEIQSNPEAVLTIEEIPSQAVSVIPGGGTRGGISLSRGIIAIDMVFLVLHGTYGEDGTIQGLFDMVGIPYTGCGTLSSAIAMDKEKTKQIWKDVGLPVLPHLCLYKGSDINSLENKKIIEKAEQTFKYPLFIKPCSAGSSCGATKVSNAMELQIALKEAFEWDYKVLIEPAINAREIECSVTGNTGGSSTTIQAYTPGEIKPSHEFYDYDAKYTDPNGASLSIPAEITEQQQAILKQTAIMAYKALDCTGLSRVDFFLEKNTGNLYLNEINTMPGFTSISMFPKMCQAGGLSYMELLDLLIYQGKQRFEDRKMLQTSRN